MRLTRLEVSNYGCFEQLDLALDPAPGRINLLVAPNGAGKSVLRQAFSDLLFGLGQQSDMVFAYPPAKLRLSAELADGSRLERRKGRGETLSDGTLPIPEARQRALLGGADATLFRQLFSLDTADLRKGGTELERSDGALGQMLLAGGGGLGAVQALLKELIEERNALGRSGRRVTTLPIWQAQDRAADARRAMKEAALRAEEWQKLQARARETDAEQRRLAQAVREMSAERDELELAQRVRPWLARRAAARAEIAAQGGRPEGGEDIAARWPEALERRGRALAVLPQAEAHLAVADAAPARQPADAALLAAAPRIKALQDEAAQAALARSDSRKLAPSRDAAAREAARLRGELGWSGDIPLPPEPAVRAARDRLKERGGLLERLRGAEREEALAAEAVRQTEEARSAVPEPGDLSALDRAVRAVLAAGDPARRMAEAERICRERDAERAAALAALPAASRARIAGSTAPDEAVRLAAEGEWRAAETSLREARRQAEVLAGEERARRARLAELTSAADLPDPAALAEARRVRDALWDVALSGDARAALDFERALRAADALADRLIAHATQTAEAAGLRQELAALAARRAAAEVALAQAKARWAAAQADFAVLAEVAGAPAGMGPDGFVGFLAARDKALAAVVAARREEDEAARLAEEQAGTAAQLAGFGLEGADLAALLVAAEARLKAGREAAEARRGAQRAAATALQALAQRRLAREAAAADLAAWERNWRGVAAGLARPEGEPPETSFHALDLVEELRKAGKQMADETQRLAEMAGKIASFGAAAAALAASLPGVSAPGAAPEAIAAAFGLALQEAHAQDARHRDWRQSRAAAEQALAAARAERDAAEAALAALRESLGAADDAAAMARLEEVRRLRAARATLAEAGAELERAGGGRDIATLEALIAGRDDIAERARIDELRAEEERVAPRKDEAVAEARSAAEALTRVRANDVTTTAAVARESAVTALGHHVEQALVLHLASALLHTALEARREEEGAGAIRRVGAALASLTLGACPGVTVAEEGGARFLLARTGEDSFKKISELSEGTRDQLYLALRLAALEDYVRAAAPLPFIADDMLQTFDDDRATAALKALLGLAQHVQVIVLTHHPHLARLARALPGGSVNLLRLDGV